MDLHPHQLPGGGVMASSRLFVGCCEKSARTGASRKNACIELNVRSRKSFPTLKPRLSKKRRRVGRVGVSVSCVQTALSRVLCDKFD